MREMRTLLRSLADDGTTIFVSSHLLTEVEAMCDRVGVMAQGRLVAQGPPSSLRGGADRMRVEVDDVAAAGRVIAGLPGFTLMGEGPQERPGSGLIRVSLNDGAAPSALNAALVAAGIGVSELAPEGSSLEDVFMALVEGADVPR